MMKNTITFLMLVLSVNCYSQTRGYSNLKYLRERSLTLTIGTGSATYYGDLEKDNTTTKANLSIGLQSIVGSNLVLRSELTWFQLGAQDFLTYRNLSFFSDNFELNSTLAFGIFSSRPGYKTRPSFNFYGFSGLGLCYFNPKTTYNGATYSLSKIQTEGISYSQFIPVVPLGLGVRFKINELINLSLEGGYRFTFTDYLDDVSTTYPSAFTNDLQRSLSLRGFSLDDNEKFRVRGNPKANDSYFLLNVKFEYYLPNNFLLGNSYPYNYQNRHKRKKRIYTRPKAG
jgi:hypothetical protein